MAAMMEQINDPDGVHWSYRGGSLDGFRVVTVIGVDRGGDVPTQVTLKMEKRLDGTANQATVYISVDLRAVMSRALDLVALAGDALLGA